MSKTVTLANNKLNVTISTLGAEIISAVKDGKEKIWEGNPDIWSGHAPVLFPICGGLKDDKFIFEGKEYILEKHGFARHREFEIESAEKEKAVFLLKDDEKTLESYPFHFEFRVKYVLDGEKIHVEYNVKNTGNKDMYFTVGSHEAYACPEGIENYSIVFDKPEDLNANILNGNLLEYKAANIGNGIKELPLKEKYFEVDALVFLSVNSRKLWLKNNISGEKTEINFEGFDYLLVWQKCGAKYICIEPWCGVPDFVDSNYDITAKKGIIKLGAGGTEIRKHSIEF